ncbi:MAG TPA: hypothetical protein VF918_00480 [Anaerolineales bacterium]
MSKPELIKKSGWAFIAGAFAFITILSGSDPIAIPGSVVSAILLAVGMSGLRTAYSERAGSFGRSMLLLGMLGPILWIIVIASMAITVTETQVTEGLWVLIFVGPAISLLGLTLFGLAALRSKPMSRLNGLPVLAGIWYPATYILFSVYDISHKGAFPDQYLPALVFMAVIQFLALCILGFVLINDSPKELATA